MSITLDGSTGITTPTYGGSVSAEYITPVTGFKNRIINGDMRIDQRNAGASVTPTVSGTYTLDRWNTNFTQASKFSVQQSTTSPSGHSNSLAVTSLAATTVPTGEFFALQYIIEGYNIADFSFGTATAKDITLSFSVRSSLTGTFGGCITNGAHDRSYPFTFTISTANTFEQKSVTISGDTAGTWATDNTAGMRLWFGLGVGDTYSGTAGEWAGATLISATGATSVVGTSGATFYITGVQLEKGTTATSFDYRPYGTELALCQRYFGIYNAVAVTSANTYSFTLPTTMRAAPTCTTTVNSGAGSAFSALGGGVSLTAIIQSTANNALATATVNCNAEL